MGNRVYVGNLSYSTTTQDLRDAFAQSGSVTDARVMTDRETGQGRGFGFVTFSTDAEATAAIGAWNGADLGGRRIVVNEAREKPAGSFNSAGGYTGGGGDDRGRGGGGGRGRRDGGGDRY
jgi:RNA recognition motif-containing protein